MEIVVARIGKPHGLRGEVTVAVHTDVPRERFVVGATFRTDPDRGELTLRSARVHQGTWLLGFTCAPDRTAAETLRGTRLIRVESPGQDDSRPGVSRESGGFVGSGEPSGSGESGEEGWYPEELVGLVVADPAGDRMGEVVALHLRPAQDLLEVRLDDGRGGLVPFVEAIVPVVDIEGRRVVLDAPDGLFDLG